MEKTLKDLIIALRCRRGTAAGTTKQGAYWLAHHPILIRSYGGDGIGSNPSQIEHLLELRHYRSGDVRAMIHKDTWHQNGAKPQGTPYTPADDVLEAQSVEEVIVALKGIEFKDTAAYSDQYPKSIIEALQPMGLPISLPAPDDGPDNTAAFVALKSVMEAMK
jgi:hypothetical protein